MKTITPQNHLNKSQRSKANRQQLKVNPKWLTALILLIGLTAFAQTPFITKWETKFSNSSITIPINPDFTNYNYTVDWGDGTITSNITGDATHRYANKGIYTVKITGIFPAIQFVRENGIITQGTPKKIVSVEQWGTQQWQSMNHALAKCDNLRVNATDSPDLSQVKDMFGMFWNSRKFNDDINHWNVSNVENFGLMFGSTPFNKPLDNWDMSNAVDLSGMFYIAWDFNQSLNNWDVSNVRDMGNMFWRASKFNSKIKDWNVSKVENMIRMFFAAKNFNQDISNWNVSNVNDMSFMFYEATSFNQDIGKWDVSSVTNMHAMFLGAQKFNKPLNNWDVSNVETMFGMFYEATSFNQDIGKWDVSSVTNMNSMFYKATNFNKSLKYWDVRNVENMKRIFWKASGFNQDLSNWKVLNVKDMELMFTATNLSTKNYDKILKAWSNLNLQRGVKLDASTYYCTSEVERQKIINNFGWQITDRGKKCEARPPANTHFVIIVRTTNTNKTVTIPINPSLSGNYYYGVDWGDGSTSEFQESSVSHTYSGARDYTVRIWGDFPAIYYNNTNNKDRVVNVIQWGTQQWQTMNSAFKGCTNLQINATDNPNFSLVTDMANMFSGATNFNSNINNWNVSNVKSMHQMFANAINFNQDLDRWQTNALEDVSGMFLNATSFNGNVYDFNLSKVEYMTEMFKGATAFNQDLDDWDTSNVTDMESLFEGATAFNGYIEDWDVTNVKYMARMFKNATSFSSWLSNWTIKSAIGMSEMFAGAVSYAPTDVNFWDVSTVTDMEGMYAGATSFNQDLSNWNIANVENLTDMFKGVKLSSENYDKLLTAFYNSNPLSNLTFNGGLSTYCTAAAARNTLINTKNWTITDGGLNTSCIPDPATHFVTKWRTNPAGETITIPTFSSSYTYNYTVDWGDGSMDEGVTGNISHTYVTSGDHTVRVWGDFPAIFFNNTGEKDKIIDVVQWGTQQWKSMQRAFYGCSNLETFSAIDNPDLSQVLHMNYMLANTAKFNANINDWDVSNVTAMYNVFENAINFNESLSNWDVSNVTATAYMFANATIFNQDLSGWDVSNVLTMDNMFENAVAFVNQDISNWDVSNVTFMRSMFDGVTLSTENYDKLLQGWSSQNLKSGVVFSGGNSMYCNSETARQNMITNFNWTISDGGKDCRTLSTDENILATILPYPNPAQQTFKLNTIPDEVTIYDITGKTVKVFTKIPSTQYQYNIEDLAPAMYVVTVTENTLKAQYKLLKIN